MFKNFGFFFLLSFFTLTVSAQKLITVSGVVRNEQNQLLTKVTVDLVGLAGKTITDEQGKYTIVSRLGRFSLSFKSFGYQTQIIKFIAEKGESIHQDVVLKIEELKTVEVKKNHNALGNSQQINLKNLNNLPLVSMNFESILKTLPGVSTNNELSSQYSVRGGNFDENLIYVNDIEINRPVLIRNGQQEGLSFVNPDLVSRANFSAGGFSAKYDDKLSSVLDVKYDRPDSNRYLITAGLMGQSVTTQSNFKKSYLLFGFRRKNNKSLLNTQDQRGSYQPSFMDIQAIYQYNFSDNFSVNLLGNFNSGSFQLIPESRETMFGTISKPIRLKIDYEGQEIDDYYSYGGGVTTNYHPNSQTSIKWINSYFGFNERERFDVDGDYIFEQIDDNNIGFGPIRKNRGIGTYYTYARNKLNTDIFSSALKFQHQFGKHELNYGFRLERSQYKDFMNEYSYIDSAGYILPANQNSFTFSNLVYAQNQLNVQNLSAYIQDSYKIGDKTDLQYGFRISHSDLSKETLFSPRLLLVHQPDEYKQWRFTAGIYHQMPSYRSIRFGNGNLYLKQLAQRSYNASVAYDFAFIGLGTRMKFTSELYYKYTDRMIPYMVDNVRIKYMPNLTASGNTYGADFSVGGELIHDLMSFFRVSFLKADQIIHYPNINPLGVLVNSASLKRPTDQRLNLSLFFQDRLFRSPTYKVHLNLLYGSRLPVGSPFEGSYNDKFSIPAYRRVDIGFSNDFLDPQLLKHPIPLSKTFQSIVLYAEVFNLLNINNTVSYLWLKDVNNVNYAIPNYLTARQLNIKLVLKLKN